MEHEPVLEPRYVPEHDSPFESIDKERSHGPSDLEARNGCKSRNREIPVIRAALANLDDDNRGDDEDDIFSAKNPRQQNRNGKARDLRSLIDQMKLQQSCDDTETRSDDSFYSAEAEMAPKDTSLSYVRDLINALGSRNSTDSKRQEIMNTLVNLNLTVQLAEPLTCSGYDDRFDIFQVCSIMLQENAGRTLLLSKYLKFLGNVLQITFKQPDLPYGLKKLIHQRVDEFELYQRLVEILDHETEMKEEIAEEFLNVVAKVIYFATSKSKVGDLNRAQEFSLQRFIKKLHDKKVKYLNKLAIKYIRYLYEIRHEQLNVSNEAYVDLEYCDWLIQSLQKHHHHQDDCQEDCVYGLYYIMNKMPMSNVRAVFDANKLKEILAKVKESYRHRHVQTELELVTEKILFFPQHGNFLTEKLQRSAVLDLNRNANANAGNNANKKNSVKQQFFASQRYNNYESLSKPTYRGVLRSITELKSPVEEFAHCDIQAFKDRRLDMILEEERKVTKFIFGALFSKQTIMEKGLNVALIPDTNHKYLVAHHVCQLLNESKHGILILGIVEKDEVRGIIEGIHMTRKDRDEFRIGLDNLMRDLVVPMPPYHRFDAPIFNPVLRHPNADPTSKDPEHFVIRLDVKKPQTDKELFYQVKRAAANRHRYLASASVAADI